jgi:hypothetical protein
MSLRSDQVAQEDLLLFINACFACTGQREFYEEEGEQRVAIAFLHNYILGNYRRLYSLCLVAGLNHFNQTEIILRLLATGKDVAEGDRLLEGQLIRSALNQLPTQRGWGLLRELQKRRINNRRSRAIARDYLSHRQNLDFEAIKYRSKVKATISHSHLSLPGELGPFLFEFEKQKAYQIPLFETFRKAHYSIEAVYQLPMTIAEGFAAKHDIPRDKFLKNIQPMMTIAEKLRYQQTADREGVKLGVDWSRLSLTKLALYLLSLPVPDRFSQQETFEAALTAAAQKTLRRSSLCLGRVALVLDNSFSSSGSTEKRQRPLGIALASHYLMRSAAREYQAFWTRPLRESLGTTAHGATDLVTPLLQALAWNPDLIVIISDGYENDPPGGVHEVLRVVRQRLDPDRRIAIVHCNPVFSAQSLTPKSLSPLIPTLGLREAEDLPTALAVARVAEGGTIGELEAYLVDRADRLSNHKSPETPSISAPSIPT